MPVPVESGVCGDGSISPGERCDDGNMQNGDGCAADCQLESTCGNGQVEPPEECDDGNQASGDQCPADCRIADPRCGDGIVSPDAGELCDDGNTAAGDGCSADCASDESCGNNVLDVQAGEACDDGNREPQDGCSAACQLESCGNGTLDAPEVCDDGNMVSGDGCSANCTSDETCGNGIVDIEAGEVCDDGNTAPNDRCSPDCTAETFFASCNAILSAGDAAGDGVYTVDPDYLGGAEPFAVYCDMSTAGGGWTVVEKSPFATPTGRALYVDSPENELAPAEARHRLSYARMALLQANATHLRIDCRGTDYLMTAAASLFNGQGGPNTCDNCSPVLYLEAQLLGTSVTDTTMCTWYVGRSEGCAGAWHIDEHAHNNYSCCSLADYPWAGSPITVNSGDAFAADPGTAIPLSDCHQADAVRYVMLR